LAGAARRRLSREAERSAGLAPRLRHAAGASLARQTRSPDRVAAKVVAASRVLLRQAGTRLEGQTRLVRQLAPERTLERGFTITRDDAGRVIKEAGRLRRGDRLVTSFADGETTSRVESSRVEAG
jgi:exodeoxyribonuclease VII large subunit